LGEFEIVGDVRGSIESHVEGGVRLLQLLESPVFAGKGTGKSLGACRSE
jgi:hypothetical protein